FWRELAVALGRGEVELPPNLRRVIIGGDRALPDWVNGWNEAAPKPIELVNTFGLTEVTAVATSTVLEGGSHSGAVSIGRPVANVRAYVLDRGLRPVPIGAVGDLFVGGTGVARGYAGSPGQTAERFVPDPFSTEDGGRMYATGDRARWREDGALEFLGRL